MEYSVTGEMEGDCTSCIRLCNRAQIVKLVNYLCKYKLGIAIYIFWRKPRNRVLYYEVHAMAEYVWVMSDDAMAYRYMQTYPAVLIQTLCDASFHSALYRRQGDQQVREAEVLVHRSTSSCSSQMQNKVCMDGTCHELKYVAEDIDR